MPRRALSVLVVSALLFASSIPVRAQRLYLRLSDRLADLAAFPPLSATRFLSIPNFTGTTEWSSPKTLITIDGIPFRLFPLNHVSPDLLPIDQNILDSPRPESCPLVMEFAAAASGSVELLRREIPDSLQLSFTFVDGSEVGDPLIYFYTRRGDPAIHNRNQTGPSGSLAISRRFGGMRVRAHLSRYNYFTTGGPQDAIIYALDASDRRNQNQNDMGSLECTMPIMSRATLSLLAGLSRREGWEMFPFTSHFHRSENITGTVRLRATELLPGADVGVLADRMTFRSRRQTGAVGGGYEEAELGIHARWSLLSTPSTLVRVAGRLSSHRIVPDSGGIQYFGSRIVRREWGLAAIIERSVNESVRGETRIRFDRFGSESAASAQVGLTYALGTTVSLRARGASVAVFPTLLESYGFFSMTRRRRAPAGEELFGVVPSFGLKPSRTRELVLGVQEAGGHEWGVDLFTQSVVAPIKQSVIKSFRSQYPQDIVRLARYINGEAYVVRGIRAHGATEILKSISLEGEYEYADAGVRFVPRHAARISTAFSLESQTTLRVGAQAISRRQWEDFALQPEDDDLLGSGFDGSLPATLSVDVVLQQELGEFFSLPKLTVQAEAQNLFNAALKTHPLGVSLGTILLFSLHASL